MISEIVIGSKNSLKLQEIRSLLKLKGPVHAQTKEPLMDYRSLLDFSITDLPLSTPLPLSNRQRAEAKASFIAETLQKPVLADEWLLVVPILGNEAQALQNKDTFQNGQKSQILPNTKMLLKLLQGRLDLERSAYCECAMALANKEGKIVKSVVARVEGVIAEHERGRASPEFSSVFLKHDYNKTLGELPLHIAQAISPRSKALEALIPFFYKLA